MAYGHYSRPLYLVFPTKAPCWSFTFIPHRFERTALHPQLSSAGYVGRQPSLEDPPVDLLLSFDSALEGFKRWILHG